MTNVTGCQKEIYRVQKNQDGTQERDYQTSENGTRERREECQCFFFFFFFKIYVTCLTSNWSPIKIKYMVRIITSEIYGSDLGRYHTLSKKKKKKEEVRVP